MPGVRLNFSKSGVSTSLGPRGATINLSKKGARANVGIPGTGLSYSTPLHQTASTGPAAINLSRPMPPSTTSGSPGKISGAGWVVSAVLALLALGKCAGDSSDTERDVVSSPAIRFVTASALNCRSTPSPDGIAVKVFARGDAIPVNADTSGWSQIVDAPACWVSSEYLSDVAPARPEANSERTEVQSNDALDRLASNEELSAEAAKSSTIRTRDEARSAVAEEEEYDLPEPTIREPLPPRPRGYPGNWANSNDYPSRALREEIEGVVRFVVQVDEAGRVASCSITGSSGSPDLDATTCSLMQRRARFTPATDVNGAPVPGSWSSSIRWEIPR